MNELKQLESLGLVMPTPAYILGAILFGIIGWVAFRRGRTKSVSALTWCGVAMMMYPYGVSETWMLWLLGIALSGLVYAKWNWSARINSGTSFNRPPPILQKTNTARAPCHTTTAKATVDSKNRNRRDGI